MPPDGYQQAVDFSILTSYNRFLNYFISALYPTAFTLVHVTALLDETAEKIVLLV